MQIRPLENTPQREESTLIAEAIDRDEGAVREIVRRYNQRLYRLARGILRDDNEAEDALQDGYLKAFSQLASFRGESSFGTWLGRIVLNEALMRQRRRRTGTALIETLRSSPFLMPANRSIRSVPWPNMKSASCWSKRSISCLTIFVPS